MIDIYSLSDPRSGLVRYIGKSVNAEKRFKAHLKASVKKSLPVHFWIAKLLSLGLEPILAIIENCSPSEWQERERFHIAQYRSCGKLLNVADGGNEPFCSSATRAANGRKNAKAIHSDAMKKHVWRIKHQLGLLLKQGYISNVSRAKMRLAASLRPDLFGQWAAIPDCQSIGAENR